MGILGDNDDPDAFWEPPVQYTTKPPPGTVRYPIRRDAVPLPAPEPPSSVAPLPAILQLEMGLFYSLPNPSPGGLSQLREPRSPRYRLSRDPIPPVTRGAPY